MSTQGDSGISFEVSNEQENFRLLELPPTLLELITSKRLSNLTLKSAALNPTEDSSQTPRNVVLCTDNQTYQVRQVQSSNSVFVLQASKTEPKDDDIQLPSLSAIARCTATLELIPAMPSGAAFLRQAIPVYRGSEDDDERLEPEASESKCRAALLEDAPFSSGEFEKAWKELCVFEEGSQAWLPTPLVLFGVWKSMISAATVRSIDLGEDFSIAALRGTVEEDGHSSALFQAVMNKLSFDGIEDLMDEYAVLDREKAVPWVGVVLLESPRETIPTAKFLQDWQNQLPEKWRKYAILDILKGKYAEPSKGNIVFSEGAEEAVVSNPSGPTKTSGKAKNWHEKFKNARR